MAQGNQGSMARNLRRALLGNSALVCAVLSVAAAHAGTLPGGGSIAAGALGDIGPKAGAAVPALIQCVSVCTNINGVWALGRIGPADRVRVTQAAARFQMVTAPGHSYYRTLREKLGWSGQLRRNQNGLSG